MLCHFLNTRPKDKATKLSVALKQKGVQVFELPLLAIEAISINAATVTILKEINQFDLVVCISPTAVEFARPYLENIDINQNQWLAVGETTKSKLLDLGVNHVDTPKHKSNEGMLAMPLFDGIDSDSKVLIFKGQGGRRLLIDELKNRNVQLTTIELYSRSRPKLLKQQYELIKSKVDTVLISSGESWQNWLSVCEDIADYQYIVLGQRIGKKLISANVPYHIIDELNPETIYNAIDYLTHHRA